MSARAGNFANGWNKFFAFKHFHIQGNFTKAYGKLSRNPKVKKYKPSKTLPFVIESGLAAITKKNIFVGGKTGLSGVTVNKE